jgi:hypothetical protein
MDSRPFHTCNSIYNVPENRSHLLRGQLKSYPSKTQLTRKQLAPHDNIIPRPAGGRKREGVDDFLEHGESR